MMRAVSNTTQVIPLNTAGRAPGQRFFEESRSRLIDGLGDGLREVKAAISEELFELADSTLERLPQTRYLDLRADIEKDWERFIETFRRKLSSAVEPGQNPAVNGRNRISLETPDFENLRLIDDADLSEHIIVRELAARLAETCDEELYTLNRRVAALLGHDENQSSQDNPLRPPAISQALSDSCAAFSTDPETRLILLRRVERHLHAFLPGIYKKINAYLIERGVLPDLKRSYRKNPAEGGSAGNVVDAVDAATPGSVPDTQAPATETAILEFLRRMALARAPSAGTSTVPAHSPPSAAFAPSSSPAIAAQASGLTAANRLPLSFLNECQYENQEPGKSIVNHIRQFRASEAAKQISGLEAVTMDIVTALFDLIFDDARIPAGAKHLISRLQIPVLKIAMLNPEFFADRRHPTRRFLSGISRISMRWSSAIDENDPFYAKLSELVERIQREFEENAAIFGQAVDELEIFVNERETEENTTTLAAATIVISRAIEADARERAGQAIRSFLKNAPQPAAITGFLEEYWITVLQRIAMGRGNTREDWESAIGVMKDLAWSVTPKKLPEDRLKLVNLLPLMLAALNKNLNRIDMPPAQRNTFFDSLVKLHAAALKGMSAEQAPAMTPPEAKPENLPPPAPNKESELLITRSIDKGVEIEEIVLVDVPSVWYDNDHEIFRQVGALKRGDWVEFTDEDQRHRERLNWISPQRGILLFSNHRSAKAISITPEALARQIRYGKAAIVHEEAIFDQALNNALESVSGEA